MAARQPSQYFDTILAKSTGMPLVFVIVERWQIILLKCFKVKVSRITAAASLMCLPVPLLAVVHWPYHPLTAFWAIWLAFCDTLMILFSWQIFDELIASSQGVIEMLETVPRSEADNFALWYIKVFRVVPQLLVNGAGSATILLVALRLPTPVVERVPVAIASLLVSGFIAGHCLYHIVSTTLFCRKITQVSGLKLIWNSPINTPGLRVLSRATQLEAKLGIILFFVTFLPLTYAYIQVHKVSVRIVYLGAMTLPLLSIVVTGLIIQGWLAEPAREMKARNLGELSAAIDCTRGAGDFSQLGLVKLRLLQQQLEIYSQLSASSSSFFQGATISQYLASIAAAALPFLVAFLLH